MNPALRVGISCKTLKVVLLSGVSPIRSMCVTGKVIDNLKCNDNGYYSSRKVCDRGSTSNGGHCMIVAARNYSNHCVPNGLGKLFSQPSFILYTTASKQPPPLSSSTSVSSIAAVSRRFFHCGQSMRQEIQIVQAPQFAESISEGDLRWEKAVGDSVKEDELVAEVETDKTTVPINSPVTGIIEELMVEDGSTVKSGQAIFKIKIGATSTADKPQPSAASSQSTQPSPPPPQQPPSSPPSSAGGMSSSPPPIPPQPSGPMSSIPVSSIKVSSPTTGGSNAGGDVGGGLMRTEQRTKMNRMRSRIAQRLKDAQNTYAMLTTFNEIDMSNIIEMRNMYKDAFLKKHNLRLGFMSAFVKAACYGLQDQPVVNAVIDNDEIIYRDYIDISVAVATPKGLVVPVIRNVENMNYAQIEQTIAGLGEKARNNALAIEDMDGGTFTISNGGVFGSLFGTPIINPPQSAILGMHAIFERPVAIKGKMEIRPMMYVALTYDHRLIDGREAVTFLRKVKAAIEDPRVLLLDV
ncbi:dihydrolipoyllysine-residue succinyltransferase component of 2-oxoglutarate dehydrogenase complex, mitochondrial [Brevipalpus obovatus]|uniref:dihydrolipoyllysine-residue succinyltransferase component of 2-oxoglutarate dehydrogenase complex, mitochondrial n=1 Tax=Brevipalpus obovatus TaxID=246614 RepID=UPI003D9E5944